uniref:Peptidase C1A papain C-terminal domain-containing protein n=1 Tax=Brassica oleracea var. oleracea TaxID=109376 RepID=A0A0D3CEE9_BRAOL
MQIKGFQYVQRNNKRALLEAVSIQPVSVCIARLADSFIHYSSGVYNASDCGITVTHAVTIVGYGRAMKGSIWSILPLQENSGILTDIPTENEILGISRGISSEYTDGIPRKHQSVGIFRGNSEEKCVPRKKPMNSEEIL